MTHRVAVALGSNLGDREEAIKAARPELERLGDLVAHSRIYESAPIGGPDQGAYLNAVSVLDVEMPLEKFLSRLREIEDEAGRVREERWGPRTLDLDIVTAVDPNRAMVLSDDPHLRLPHPRAHERRFVLEALAEVWPGAPLTGGEARALLAGVSDQDLAPYRSGPSMLSRRWVAAQLVLFALFGLVAVSTRADLAGARLAWGLGVMLGGAGLMLWAVRHLGEALSPYPEPLPATQLVATGPYRWVRHPIYTAVIVVLTGAALFAGSWPAGLVVAGISAFFWFKAGYEERNLSAQVPGYDEYLHRVRGRLLPRGVDP